ncbi:hypothetical protein ACFW4X_23925 [Streptomyces smyrnaeus]|uniref:hypothetical protein n=1 Tax=Streptomyces smyrnaeus TaxID=1387713 RepID=UPI0036CD17F5
MPNTAHDGSRPVRATTEASDSPASLYGRASLVLGVIALVTLALGNHVGIGIPLLTGSLAVTFGIMGLYQRLNRVQCVIGLTTGGLAVLSLATLLILMFG